LSGGNRRKVSSILTFIGNPSLLFLDEPCSGMDRYSKIKLWNLISTYCKAKGASAILTTHYVSEVERYCTRIGILKDGKLISIGKPRQLV
jgi:ABC-type multidrug transport system ATPase subunit